MLKKHIAKINNKSILKYKSASTAYKSNVKEKTNLNYKPAGLMFLKQ